MSDPVPDAEVEHLVRSSAEGDLDAFDRLVGIYQDKVFGLAYNLVRDYDEAQEVAQEVFISCFRNLKRFRFESRFSTWLYRVTVNQVKNRWKYHRRRQRDKHESLDTPRDEDDPRRIDPPDEGPDPRQAAEGRERMEAFEKALGALSLEYRQVLTLRFIEDLQYNEIAEILDCSIGTVKSRINRARKTLREKMRGVL
ncbi:sigma-70 family RNA polymerase sigma factor [Candidatus Sumerlaeota bacterium]|nr:sigma-70 family RNA polymerase sigma factor [Candidatus Sumerlaeota bacterium]